MAMMGYTNNDTLGHYMTIEEHGEFGGNMTTKNSQCGDTTVMQSQRAPTEMGYDELSENILAFAINDEKKLTSKRANGNFKSRLNESSDTHTFNSEFGEYCDKQKLRKAKYSS